MENKTEVRIYFYDDTNKEFDVVLKDGGIASIHVGEDGNYRTTYYQSRLDPSKENIVESLEGYKSQIKTWDVSDVEFIMKDACNWLLMVNKGFNYTKIYVDYNHVQRDIKQFIS